MKTKEQLRDEAADKYSSRILHTLESSDARVRSFKAGWDAREKLDDEDLKIALEALNAIYKKVGSIPFSNMDRWGDDLEHIYRRLKNALAKIEALK